MSELTILALSSTHISGNLSDLSNISELDTLSLPNVTGISGDLSNLKDMSELTTLILPNATGLTVQDCSDLSIIANTINKNYKVGSVDLPPPWDSSYNCTISINNITTCSSTIDDTSNICHYGCLRLACSCF